MPTIDSDESFAIVSGDVTDGLGDMFEPNGSDPVTVAEAFLDTEVISNTEIFVVPWSYRCRHTGDFHGLFPTGRDLEIQGVTFVDHRGGDTQLHRYVDWAGVIGQLGLSVSGRVPVTEDEYRYGRRRLGIESA